MMSASGHVGWKRITFSHPTGLKRRLLVYPTNSENIIAALEVEVFSANRIIEVFFFNKELKEQN